MKLLLLLAAALAALASAAPISEEQYEYLFSRFTTAYNKQYTMTEFLHRLNTFKANLNMVMAHNAANVHSYTMAMNEFGDLTFDEFKSRLGLKRVKGTRAASASPSSVADKAPNGPTKDWRQTGVVNAVKNQGQCGSCWAFSATAAIESTYAIATGKLYDLSESQLVDCSTGDGNEGCNGGFMNNAFQYVLNSGGLCESKDYPYVPVDAVCKAHSCKHVAPISSFEDVPMSDEDALLATIFKTVVSVAVEVNSNFQFYSSGVFDGPCGVELNHGIAAVGYNTNEGFYIVRNSWGKSWGEGGYIRMAIGKNLCGIAEAASFVKA